MDSSAEFMDIDEGRGGRHFVRRRGETIHGMGSNIYRYLFFSMYVCIYIYMYIHTYIYICFYMSYHVKSGHVMLSYVIYVYIDMQIYSHLSGHLLADHLRNPGHQRDGWFQSGVP